MTEGMLDIRRFFALPDAVQKQQAIAGINNGVDAFGYHGRAAGDAGCHELGNGNARIGRNGGINGNFRIRLLAHRNGKHLLAFSLK